MSCIARRFPYFALFGCKPQGKDRLHCKSAAAPWLCEYEMDNSDTGLGTASRRLTQIRWSKKAAILVGQSIAGLVCSATVFLGVTWFLSDAPRPRLREATFGPAENWPEIKNGVPELWSVKTSASGQFDRVNGVTPRGVPTTEEVPPPRSDANAVSTVGYPSEGAPVDLAPEAGTVSTPTPEAQIVSMPADDARQIAGAPPLITDEEPQTIEYASAPAAPASLGQTEAQNVSAGPAAYPSSPHAPARSRKAAAEKEKKRMAGRLQQERANALEVIAPAGPASSVKPRSSTGQKQIERRKERLATAPRTTTAGTQPGRGRDTSTTAAAAQPEAEDERVRLLGIPLPTGREVKECLLEFRC